MNKEVIDVVCFVFPDGNTHFHQAGTMDMDKIVAAWESGKTPEQTALYKACDVSGGYMLLRMTKEDFEILSKRLANDAFQYAIDRTARELACA